MFSSTNDKKFFNQDGISWWEKLTKKVGLVFRQKYEISANLCLIQAKKSANGVEK